MAISVLKERAFNADVPLPGADVSLFRANDSFLGAEDLLPGVDASLLGADD